MAGTPKVLAQFSPTNANTTLATVGASKRWVISAIYAYNTDSVAQTLRMNHVRSGDSAAVKNRIVPDVSVPTADFFTFGGGMVMEAGDTLQGMSPLLTSIFGVTVYGIEESV